MTTIAVKTSKKAVKKENKQPFYHIINTLGESITYKT